MALRIVQRDVGPVTVLDLAGKLAGEAGETLTDRIDDLLAAGRRQLILNLRNVSFVDSAALGGLLASHTTVARAGGRLKLLGLTERVRDLMVTTRLETVFDTFRAEDDALRSFP